MLFAANPRVVVVEVIEVEAEVEEEGEEEEKEKEEVVLVLDCWQEDSLQPCNSKPHLPMLMPKPPDNSLKSSLVIIPKQTTLLKKSKDISEPTDILLGSIPQFTRLPLPLPLSKELPLQDGSGT